MRETGKWLIASFLGSAILLAACINDGDTAAPAVGIAPTTGQPGNLTPPASRRVSLELKDAAGNNLIDLSGP